MTYTQAGGAFVILAALALRNGAPADDAGIADAYLIAYQNQDFAALEELYAADAVFIDPTSFDVAPVTAPIEWHGRDAILEGLAGWGVDRLEYDVERQFSASGHVVFDGAVTATYLLEDAERQYRFPIVTIITVSDGHVVEHRDYTDYAGMAELDPGTGTGQ